MCHKLSCEVLSVRTIIIYLMFIQMVKLKFSCFPEIFLFSYTIIDLFINENCVLTSMQGCRIYLLLYLCLDDLHCAAYKLVFTYEIWEVIFEVKRHFTGSKLLFVVVYKLQVNLTLINLIFANFANANVA